MDNHNFQFNPDLARAETIPASWYTDPARLQLEHRRIFRRTWQCAAPLEQLRFPGNYVACDVAGVPVVLTRDPEGELHAFYNVCRHRAGIVAKGAGNRKTLQCLYHGWLYGLDGCLRTTPEFEGVENFDRQQFGLVPIRVETWGPFAFVNMDAEAPPLLEVLGNIPAETARFEFGAMRKVERRDYYVNCNWKVYIDNYLEGYHVPVAHPGLYPLSQEHTLTIFEWYFSDPGTPETWNNLQDSMAFSDEIQQEDIEICEDVWKNLQTGIYDRGRYCVKRENGVHHFHQLLSEYLT